MADYNLTPEQKELLRHLVDSDRKGQLSKPFLPICTFDECYIGLEAPTGTDRIRFRSRDDLDALCDEDLLGVRLNRQGTHGLYSLKQFAYDAVDDDFEMPESQLLSEARARTISIAAGDQRVSSYLAHFLEDHPNPEENVFLMMRFSKDEQYQMIAGTIRRGLDKHGLHALRADDRAYSDDLWDNVCVYMLGMGGNK